MDVGYKKDQGKLRIDLVPPEVITELAGILTKGAEKYPARNWELGMDWSRVYSSLQRHILAWYSGEDKDPESNQSHLSHALCNIAFLVTYEQRRTGNDDRIKSKTSLGNLD